MLSKTILLCNISSFNEEVYVWKIVSKQSALPSCSTIRSYFFMDAPKFNDLIEYWKKGIESSQESSSVPSSSQESSSSSEEPSSQESSASPAAAEEPPLSQEIMKFLMDLRILLN